MEEALNSSIGIYRVPVAIISYNSQWVIFCCAAMIFGCVAYVSSRLSTTKRVIAFVIYGYFLSIGLAHERDAAGYILACSFIMGLMLRFSYEVLYCNKRP
jgi:hypothetical protein